MDLNENVLIAFRAFLISERQRHLDDIATIDRKLRVLELVLNGLENSPAPWITEAEILNWALKAKQRG